jgi:hypothetical protein
MNLTNLARTIPLGSYFLASKDCYDSEELWKLLLSGPDLMVLRDVSHFVAESHRGHGNRLRYVIVGGQTGSVLYGPFCSIYDYEIQSNRIVDVV